MGAKTGDWLGKGAKQEVGEGQGEQLLTLNLLILCMLAGDFFIHAIDRSMDATSIAAVRVATTLGGILVTVLQQKQKIAALSVLQNWRLRQIQKKEEHFQNNLQVAIENRKGLPNLRCKKIDVSKWCS